MSSLSSDSLFHFTPKFEYLTSILEKGFIPRYCLEFEDSDNDLFDILSPSYKAMVCFCDIPLDLIGNHMKMYGSYGISLSKDWGIRKGLSPIFYINRDSYFMKLFRQQIQVASLTSNNLLSIIAEMFSFSSVNSLIKADSSGKLSKEYLNAVSSALSFGTLTSFFKPYEGDYTREGITKTNYRYYDEKEWRHLPDHTTGTPNRGPLSHIGLTDDEKNRLNAFYENDLRFHLGFDCDDIEFIIIKEIADNDKLINLFDILKGKLPNNYTDAAVDRLKHRIRLMP